MKKLISLLLVVILICSALVGCDWSNILKQNDTTATITTTSTVPTSNDSQNIIWEEKIIWEGDVDANFVVGELMVVLDKAISAPNKVHSPDFFVGVDIVEIYDCTKRKDPENVWEDFHQILHLRLADTYDTKEKTLEAMRILAPILGIVSVSPNMILSWDYTPNDTFFNNSTGIWDQWGHEKIQVEKAWDFTTGTSEIKVGVLDKGISEHIDLNDNYVISNAADFYDETTATPYFNKIDLDGHGTHVAGIVGATGNNSIGVCGVNWDISIVQLRAIGSETGLATINAIYWAMDYGVDIVSLSASAYYPLPDIEQAIRDYCNQGGLFICSTGNKEQDNDTFGQYNYPSYYASDSYANKIGNMITVGRVDNNDTRPYKANWGFETIDIYAPGQYILSTFPVNICVDGNYGVDTENGNTYWACECEYIYDEISEDEFEETGKWVYVSKHHQDGYHFMSGSSMSTPYVSGVAALLLSVNQNLTANQIENCIINGADTITIATGDGQIQTVKRLNAWGAFKYLMENYPIYERNPEYIDCTYSYSIDADASFMKDNTSMMKFNISRSGSYQFTVSSDFPIDVKLYYNDLQEIATTQIKSDENSTIEFTYNLTEGIYYLRTNFVNESAEGTVSVTIDCPPHTHSYTEWTKLSSTHHIECCEYCGQAGTTTALHVVKLSEVTLGIGHCMYCGAKVMLKDDIVQVGPMSITKVTINGSYILPNGIIVLVDEDIEAYENGTLVFYDKDNLPQTQ